MTNQQPPQQKTQTGNGNFQVGRDYTQAHTINHNQAGRDHIQIGRDYTHTTTVNLKFWFSVLIVIALGSTVLIGHTSDLLPFFQGNSSQTSSPTSPTKAD